MAIGKLERVPLREVWKHEAHDFTVWMEENLDVLSEVLDINLSNVEREKGTGNFSVDLVAEDDNGNAVIIENQLEKSNHDHLGKVITYLAAVGAKTAIWIVSDPRTEHVAAINWLNESTAASFYLLKVEAIKIGASEPAPLLTEIVGPSEEGKQIGQQKKEIAERHVIRRRFWTQLLEHAKSKTKLHSTISPSQYNWIGTGTGVRGVGLNYSLTQHEVSVEIYIDRGKDADEENSAIFDQLHAEREALEAKFGSPLEWQSLPTKRACRVRYMLKNGGYRDEEEWESSIPKAVDTMIRFEAALRPHIKKLQVGG